MTGSGWFVLSGMLSMIFFRLSNTGWTFFHLKVDNFTLLSKELCKFFLQSRFDNSNSKVILDYLG